MPSVLHPCAHPRCPTLAPFGQARCDRHEAERRTQQAARLAADPREQARKRELNSWYDAEWRAYSKAFVRAHPSCVRCGRPSHVTDHIRPWKRGATDAEKRALFHDPANHQAMCWPCHSSATARHDGGFGNPTREGKA